VLGVASITPAFPKIARELNISKPSVGLLIMMFTLPGIFLAPILGVMADRFGRKRVLVPALFLFGLAGGGCFFMRDFHLLLVFRFFQGCGAAALGALNVTLIGDLFSGRQRATAMGYNASVLSFATATYPFIGGVLTGFGWHYPFLLPIFAIPIGLVVLFKLKTPEPQEHPNFKIYLRNAALSLRGRMAVLYFSAGLVVFIILYGSYLTYIPLFLAEKYQATPLQIGLVFSSMSIVTAITASQTGKFVRILGEKTMLLFSFILYACGLCLLFFLSKMWMVVLPIGIYGFGHGLNMPAFQTLLTGLAPLEYRAAFMSINGMVLRLGQTLGPLITGGVYLVGGIQATFFCGAALALIMFTALMIWGRERVQI
jgi:MFS transporter, ACDE family, multidrug resistance protein